MGWKCLYDGPCCNLVRLHFGQLLSRQVSGINRLGSLPIRLVDNFAYRSEVAPFGPVEQLVSVLRKAQIEFIDMVIEHLTDQGMMDPELLYEPPFTGVAPTGPEHLFDEAKVVRLVSKIREINESAVA